MTFPNFINKHLEEALFNAHDFLKYKKTDLRNFPSNYIIAYQQGPLDYFKRAFKGKYKIIKFSGQLKVHKLGDIGFVKLDGIGAPHAGTLLEELIALGGKRFINLGTAGGLQHRGTFLCEKAIRDEGTSSHYAKHEKYAYPSRELTRKLGECLTRQKLIFEKGITWTIDAPYRETKAEVEQYRNEGVATVEMEASALFAIAKLRKVEIAAAFAVSDLLKSEWEPEFHTMNLKKSLNKIVDAAVDCLRKK